MSETDLGRQSENPASGPAPTPSRNPPRTPAAFQPAWLEGRKQAYPDRTSGGDRERLGLRDVASGPGALASADLDLWMYIRPLVRWWWLIAICVVIGGASGYLGARLSPRVYQSRTTLMVGQALQNPNPSATDLYTDQTLAQFYVDFVKREPVLKGTLNALGIPWDWTVLRAMVTSRVVVNTQLIEISILDNDPQRVQLLTAELAHQLILQSPATTDPEREAERQFVESEMTQLKAEIQKSRAEIKSLDDVISQSSSARQIEDARNRQTSLQAQISTWETTYAQLLSNLQQGTNILSIVEPAQAPLSPVSSGAGVSVALGLAMGLLLSVAAAYLLEFIDDTLKTPEDVRETLGLKTLGRLPRLENLDDTDRLVVANQSRSAAAGAYRVLRTNLQFHSIDYPVNTLMVTSPGPGEGKSMISANLAAAVALSGRRVILVDADLWRPTQNLIFQMEVGLGLTSLLMGEVNLTEALQATPVPNLQLLTAGPLPPNPADLLSSRTMGYLIEALREQADMIIFDCPPVSVDADAAILATRLEGVVLVVDAGHTRRSPARHSREALSAVGAHVLGVALNRVREEAHTYSTYYAKDWPRKRKFSPRTALLSLFKRKGEKARPAKGPAAKVEVLPQAPSGQKDL